jgi:hypothetical protein
MNQSEICRKIKEKFPESKEKAKRFARLLWPLKLKLLQNFHHPKETLFIKSSNAKT